MSRRLAELLDQPQVLVESAIKRLENWSGWQSADVRLLAQINNKVRQKTAELGLDPDDTTGPELYHALLVKLSSDEKSLTINREELLARLAKIYRPSKVYALKHSVAKELLRKTPPRKVMKQLGYRSVDSMLKRANVCELFTAAQQLESPSWTNGLWKKLARLHPSDFETQKIEIVTMPNTRWKNKDVTNNPLLGCVMVWPNQAGTINLSVQVARNVNELRAACAYIKLKQVQPDFGKQLVAVSRGGLGAPAEISHLPVSWQAIFNQYGKRPASEHTEFFGPLLLHEDIKLAQSLVQISPVFRWWQDLECAVKRAQDGLVSLNLADVAKNYSQKNSYKNRSVDSAQNSVWYELLDRYMQYPTVEQHLMAQLEPQEAVVPNGPTEYAAQREIRQLNEAVG